jgi:cytidylate kinase
LLTEFLTLNTGESPNVAEESTLSQILEVNAPEKYYLSAKACEGILRRAERRGKQLPPMLKEALEQMVEREKVSTDTTNASQEMSVQPSELQTEEITAPASSNEEDDSWMM